jgi:hypothetical protein
LLSKRAKARAGKINVYIWLPSIGRDYLGRIKCAKTKTPTTTRERVRVIHLLNIVNILQKIVG